MQNIGGRPELLKKMNRTLLYQALIELGTATRAELAEHTKISATTVRTLLEELLKGNEIVEAAIDVSSGGRRAVRYALNNTRNRLLLLYLETDEIVFQILSLTGEVCKSGALRTEPQKISASAIRLTQEFLDGWNLCAIGLGVPGIVENRRYFYSDSPNTWNFIDTGEKIQDYCQLPVVLENDLNAVAVGFALHRPQGISGANLAYIHFNKTCTGAGILVDGKITRGAQRFAGELGFLPLWDDRTIDEVLRGNPTVQECARMADRAVSVVNCVINPEQVVIGGIRFADPEIHTELLRLRAMNPLPDQLRPELIFSCNYRSDYLAGLFHLTREHILPFLPITAVGSNIK